MKVVGVEGQDPRLDQLAGVPVDDANMSMKADPPSGVGSGK